MLIPNMGIKRKAPPRQARSGGLADALFSSTQQRVLAWLFGQPERSFFTKELIDLAAGGSGAVQRELARLQSSGLIVQTVLGSRKHYRANAKAPTLTLEQVYAALAPAEKQLGRSVSPTLFTAAEFRKRLAARNS